MQYASTVQHTLPIESLTALFYFWSSFCQTFFKECTVCIFGIYCINIVHCLRFKLFFSVNVRCLIDFFWK